jgi:pyridoxine kinase
MSRILVISSWVARGHVGLSAAVPVLQGLGLETVALPTVLLSNHPGHAHSASRNVPVAQLDAMFDALVANGWLGEISAVLTGYFPTPAHVDFAATAIARVQAAVPGVHVCCDPVLGDDPAGLYVAGEVATTVKARLLPLAHTATPNRFELQWLSGLPVADAAQAVAAARTLAPALTLATSVPSEPGHVANLVVSPEHAWITTAPLHARVPHGTGDVLAAAWLAALTASEGPPSALASAAGRLAAIVAASQGADELRLTTIRQCWASAPRAAVTQLC